MKISKIFFSASNFILLILITACVAAPATQESVIPETENIPSYTPKPAKETEAHPITGEQISIPIYDLPMNESENPATAETWLYVFKEISFSFAFDSTWVVTPVDKDSLEKLHEATSKNGLEVTHFIEWFSKLALQEYPDMAYSLCAFKNTVEQLEPGKTVFMYTAQFYEPERVAIPLDRYTSIFLHDMEENLEFKNVWKVISDNGMPMVIIESKTKTDAPIYMTHILANTGKAYLEITIQTYDPDYSVLKDLRLTLRSFSTTMRVGK
ncbi:MAG: hypothetical protein H6635_00130 [Anaerolineales bacterium]|nr:hypothetical protein [Anaerolineales bacterium]